ncbi:MAG: hypothetical protein JST67_03590 [Bacteroidetes bacterium]|nr:hypothetical protein [Bacteroidota bacterium]
MKYFFINPKAEILFFYAAVLFNLYPLFFGTFFPFMDAPAHLYNASLINALLKQDAFVHTYMQFNSTIVPNWISYFITSPLLRVVPPNIAEKAVLLVFFIGLPFSVRYAIKAFNEKAGYLAFLSIPICYNFLTMISFFNFSIGFVSLFYAIGFFYKKICVQQAAWHHYLLFLVLLLATYFSHIVLTGVLLLFLFFVYIFHTYKQQGTHIAGYFSKKTITLVALALPVVFLVVKYIAGVHANGHGTYTYLSNYELVNYITSGRIFTVFNGDQEGAYSGLLAIIYIGLLAISLYFFVLYFSQKKELYAAFFFPSLLVFAFLLVLYKVLPDGDGLAGYVTIRIVIILFLIAILVVANIPLNPTFGITICGLALCIHFMRLPYYANVIKNQDELALSVFKQAEAIKEKSFVVDCKWNDNWLTHNFVNYLGVNKSVLCLMNYEASLPYFPLRWNNAYQISVWRNNLLSFKNIEETKKSLENKNIYYWIQGDINNRTDSASLAFTQNIKNYCVEINRTDFASLYQLK